MRSVFVIGSLLWAPLIYAAAPSSREVVNVTLDKSFEPHFFNRVIRMQILMNDELGENAATLEQTLAQLRKTNCGESVHYMAQYNGWFMFEAGGYSVNAEIRQSYENLPLPLTKRQRRLELYEFEYPVFVNPFEWRLFPDRLPAESAAKIFHSGYAIRIGTRQIILFGACW